MPFKIVRNDLTKMQVDTIVNTANERPKYSSGTDTAVYKAAGEEELLAERKKIGYMREGEVSITPGFKLSAKYIIHAVSPRYIDGNSGEEDRLRDCYKKSLALAVKHECKSIAFLMKQDMLVYLVVFDTAATKLGLNLYPDLEAYIDHNYVCDKREEEYGDRYFGSVRSDAPGYDAYRMERRRLEEKLRPVPGNMQIGVKGLSNAEVYKRDIIFSFFIEHEVFDMIEMDIALEERGLPCFVE